MGLKVFIIISVLRDGDKSSKTGKDGGQKTKENRRPNLKYHINHKKIKMACWVRPEVALPAHPSVSTTTQDSGGHVLVLTSAPNNPKYTVSGGFYCISVFWQTALEMYPVPLFCFWFICCCCCCGQVTADLG